VPPPEILSTQTSLAARVALQEQRLRDAVLYSDQEDSADLLSASDMESTLLQPTRNEQSEQGSPLISEIPAEEKHVVRLSISYKDLPPEVQNMIQQYEAMEKVEIVYSNNKKNKYDDEASSMDVADSITTTDIDTEAEAATTSEAETEEASVDRTSEDKSDDENDSQNNNKAEKIGI
jgi:hypothetical protein